MTRTHAPYLSARSPSRRLGLTAAAGLLALAAPLSAQDGPPNAAAPVDQAPRPRGAAERSPPPDGHGGPDGPERPPLPAWAKADGPRGLTVHEPGVSPGYVLYSPLAGTSTYLLDNDGELLHEWPARLGPSSVYLLDDGSILRTARLDDPPRFHGGGIYGLVERIAPDGEVLWSYELADDERVIHHDVEVMPGGNLLFIAWEHKQPSEALAAGRHPEALGEEGFWPDVVFELRPEGEQGGEIVWEWRAFDHLVQDMHPKLDGYGQVAEHPGRIDVNGDHRDQRALTAAEIAAADDLEEQMRALGYVGGDEDDAEDDRRKKPDWLHTNAVDYHAGLDLIVLSSPEMNELWVIDHSTTTEEARGGTGGRWGHGGELLWRWGNPRNHAAGDDDDRTLWYQHDPQWLDGSNAGAGARGPGAARVEGELRLTVFNNGGGRDGEEGFSSVDELVLPFDPERGFVGEPGAAWGPAAPAWSYREPVEFLAPFISGAQRLPSGNTLVCEGPSGRVFEVTPAGEIVWEWRNPWGGEVKAPKGTGGIPPNAVFRATRYAPDHPGVLAVLGEG